MDDMTITSHCDHTLLSVTATESEILALCDDGIRYKTASVCIPPCFVKRAKEYVGNSLAICTVIGFPNGYQTTAVKVFEAKNAIENGADEIDTVINLTDLKDGNHEHILKELKALKQVCGKHILKVIIETCLLTEQEKVQMCRIVTASGADYIKTSTGFSTGGATKEDVALLRREVGPSVKVKASGGISNLEDAETFLRLGADRLGTSRVVKAVKAKEKK